MPIKTTSFAHVRLTVTDINRSRAFYESLFDWPVAVELPADADAATREHLQFLYGGVIYRVGTGLFGLRPVASDRFDEGRVGLDHVSFALESRAQLDEAAALLDQRSVPHEAIKDIGTSCILEFRDPDNIALELSAPKA
ncbi:MAG: VOC family protein [Candidatus Dormibacteraceae bacterium]